MRSLEPDNSIWENTENLQSHNADTMEDTKTLLALPTELKEQILRTLPCSDLFAIILTCHQLKNIAKSLLYKSVTIRNPQKIQSFAQTISQDPTKASSVLSFTLEFPEKREQQHARSWADETIYGENDALVLALLPNIEHLKVTSPWESDTELGWLFDNASIKNESTRTPHISTHLRTLHIDYWRDGWGFFGGGELGSIFLQPCLEAVSLCNMYLGVPFTNLATHMSSSPLQKLRIINCDIDPRALASIINTASSIKEVEMWTTMTTVHQPRENAPFVIQDWATAMHSARHTLKKLVLEDIDINPHPADRRDYTREPIFLGEFTTVTHLEIYCNDILPTTSDNENENLNTTVAASEIFPPNLETLKFLCRCYNTYSDKYWQTLAQILEDNYCLQKLRKIIVKTDWPHYFRFPTEFVAACDKRGIELVEDAAYLRPFFADNFYGEGGQFP